MSYDPASGQVSFEPLGLDLGLDQLPVLPWAGDKPEDGLIVGEFIIHPAFVPLYLSLGPDLVGLPVTQPFANNSSNRFEQHFENLGMFYRLDDPEKRVALLKYGLVQCGDCGPQQNPGLTNAIIQEPITEPFFYQQMAQWSISMSVTGDVVDGPLDVVDGSTELVLEYMALSARDGVMQILPLPVLMGLKDPNYYDPIGLSELVFIPIKDGAGHNVLRVFDIFIRQNGGYVVSGQPITELISVNPEIRQIRQCFENYCLDYLPDLPDHRVRPVRLGARYLEQGFTAYVEEKDGSEVTANQVQRHINPFTLLVWEHPTVVDSQTPETISVMVALENTPQPGLEIILSVTYPDGTEAVITMPPTEENGITSFTLDPVQGENGDLVFYETCLLVQGETQLCVEQTFMIWGNP
jgi:hypothetical protein